MGSDSKWISRIPDQRFRWDRHLARSVRSGRSQRWGEEVGGAGVGVELFPSPKVEDGPREGGEGRREGEVKHPFRGCAPGRQRTEDFAGEPPMALWFVHWVRVGLRTVSASVPCGVPVFAMMPLLQRLMAPAKAHGQRLSRTEEEEEDRKEEGPLATTASLQAHGAGWQSGQRKAERLEKTIRTIRPLEHWVQGSPSRP
jgi:hypothetical protein